MARRSARLATAAVKKPQPAPDLSTAIEHDNSLIRDASQRMDGTATVPQTPESACPEPPFEKMHPTKLRPCAAKHSSAERFGFRDIPAKAHDAGLTGLPSVPSENPVFPTSSFTFRGPMQSQELSHEAEQVRQILQKDAAVIKAKMMATRDADRDADRDAGDRHKSMMQDRRIAMPKGRSGRFSAAHMAEFKKMDSIQGHASAWRAQPGRFTPVDSSKLKRSLAKADLDETPAGTSASATKTLTSRRRMETSSERLHRRLRRASQDRIHNATDYQTQCQSGTTMAQPSAAKRQKRHEEDDISTMRPVARETNNLGEPVSVKPRARLASLLSPTKSFLARSARPDQAMPCLIPSPSKSNFTDLAKSTWTRAVGSVARRDRPDKDKTMTHTVKLQDDAAKSFIPQPTAQTSQTPVPRRINKEIPTASMTTPHRKLIKRVTFAEDLHPEAVSRKRQQPTPWKPNALAGRTPLRDVSSEYVTQDDSPTETESCGASLYPDLKPLRRLIHNNFFRDDASSPGPPGAFTFRSNHTIKPGDTPIKGLGSTPGQSSVRQVGSPTKDAEEVAQYSARVSPTIYSDKENRAPTLFHGAAHGIANKKRHRADSDGEDGGLESAQRSMKKTKRGRMPACDALFAPDLIGGARDINTRPMKSPRHISVKVPSRAAAFASPNKKTATLSRGRLDMLSRPKKRD